MICVLSHVINFHFSECRINTHLNGSCIVGAKPQNCCDCLTGYQKNPTTGKCGKYYYTQNVIFMKLYPLTYVIYKCTCLVLYFCVKCSSKMCHLGINTTVIFEVENFHKFLWVGARLRKYYFLPWNFKFITDARRGWKPDPWKLGKTTQNIYHLKILGYSYSILNSNLSPA